MIDYGLLIEIAYTKVAIDHLLRCDRGEARDAFPTTEERWQEISRLQKVYADLQAQRLAAQPEAERSAVGP